MEAVVVLHFDNPPRPLVTGPVYTDDSARLLGLVTVCIQTTMWQRCLGQPGVQIPVHGAHVGHQWTLCADSGATCTEWHGLEAAFH